MSPFTLSLYDLKIDLTSILLIPLAERVKVQLLELSVMTHKIYTIRLSFMIHDFQLSVIPASMSHLYLACIILQVYTNIKIFFYLCIHPHMPNTFQKY